MSKFKVAAASAGRRVRSAWFTIEGLEGMRPRLHMRPANESNPKYFDALLRAQRKGRKAMKNIRTADVKQIRVEDAELLAKHCAVGWEDGSVLDADGTSVPFSREDCRGLLLSLAEHDDVEVRQCFDDFRGDVADAASFHEVEDEADIEETAGN